MIVTTSWDDGTTEDTRICALLNKYELKGTFYICPKIRQQKAVLTEQQIQEISALHEIGAHTLTHPHLTELPIDDARKEITESKKWVESVTRKPCTMFCYPYGDYNECIKTLLEEAGFTGARTTEGLCFGYKDHFALPTTLQVRPFPFRKEYSKWWHRLDPLGPLRYRYRSLRRLGITHAQMSSWLSLAKALVVKARKQNGHVHIWGHSSEVAKLDMWNELEELFAFIREQEHTTPVTNSDLLQ